MMIFWYDDDKGTIAGMDLSDNPEKTFREILDSVGDEKEIVKRRASHIVPRNLWKRFWFRVIRLITGDGKRFPTLEEWTRIWRGGVRLDLRPSGGPIITFIDRKSAIAAERRWIAARKGENS